MTGHTSGRLDMILTPYRRCRSLGKVNVVSANADAPLTGTFVASYNEVDTSAITVNDIIGQKTENGIYTGLQAAELIYQTYNAIPNLSAAPGWSSDPCFM